MSAPHSGWPSAVSRRWRGGPISVQNASPRAARANFPSEPVRGHFLLGQVTLAQLPFDVGATPVSELQQCRCYTSVGATAVSLLHQCRCYTSVGGAGSHLTYGQINLMLTMVT